MQSLNSVIEKENPTFCDSIKYSEMKVTIETQVPKKVYFNFKILKD